MVGATTLKPGEKTTLELPLPMGMHQGMDKLHVFAVDIRSNDPAEPLKTLKWRFLADDIEGNTGLPQGSGAHH